MDQRRQTTRSAYTRNRFDPCTDKRPGPPLAVAHLQTCRPWKATENRTRPPQTLSRSRSHPQHDYHLRSPHPPKTARQQRNPPRHDCAPLDKPPTASVRDPHVTLHNHHHDRSAHSKTRPSCKRARNEAQPHQTQLHVHAPPPPQKLKAILAATRECASSACR